MYPADEEGLPHHSTLGALLALPVVAGGHRRLPIASEAVLSLLLLK